MQGNKKEVSFMATIDRKLVIRFGFWSAVLTALFSIGYITPQIIFMAFYTPAKHWELTWLTAPSLFLAPSFVVLMVSIHFFVQNERKIWSLIGLSFTIIYAVLVSMVYYVQLGLAIPHMIRGQTEEIATFILEQNSLMITIDILGYGFMSLATLFVAFAFKDGKLQRWIRYLFIANGFLAFPILLQVYWPELVYIAGLWTVTFIVPVILLAVLFRKA
jgi:hypothetical protein